jgi:signal transduction histidine kinase
MKVKGIVFKLWLAMLALVVVVLLLAGLIQAGIIQKIILGQQSDRIINEGKKLADHLDIISDGSQMQEQVDDLAGYLGASVLVVDRGGEILAWNLPAGWGFGMGRGAGMGMGMGRGAGTGIGMGMTEKHNAGRPFDARDVAGVLAGGQLARKEYNSYFKTDIMQVGIPVLSSGKVTGGVMIQAPLAPIVSDIRALQQSALYALILGGLIATLLAFLLARNIVRPLLTMNRVARAMAEGDYGLQAPLKSSDEIGLLAESLNVLSLRLKEKIAELDRLDNTRREFVASVSHELRTPLTIIQGYTEALVDGMGRDQTQREQYLNNIHEETLRLKRLVEDLLNIRSMEAGGIGVELKDTDMLPVIKRVLGRFNNQAGEKGQILILENPGGPAHARLDEDKIEQVIINLVDNALRFTPPGGEVAVSAVSEGDRLRVSVRDSGPGIPPCELPLVWERFYKTDRSRRRETSGSGLGLAIVRGIVELHGGDVGIDSLPGKGSTFWFTIPRGS